MKSPIVVSGIKSGEEDWQSDVAVGLDVPRATEIEEQNKKCAGVADFTSSDNCRRLCRPCSEEEKACRARVKVTGQAQWIMCVVSSINTL